jgi:hypothetical protein
MYFYIIGVHYDTWELLRLQRTSGLSSSSAFTELDCEVQPGLHRAVLCVANWCTICWCKQVHSMIVFELPQLLDYFCKQPSRARLTWHNAAVNTTV